jgi:hypothetical protein
MDGDLVAGCGCHPSKLRPCLHPLAQPEEGCAHAVPCEHIKQRWRVAWIRAVVKR